MEEKPKHSLPTQPIARGRSAVLILQEEPQVYSEGLALQQRLFDANLAAKVAGLPTANTLMICQHLPVYTIGKSGKETNMLFDPAQVGASLVHVGRGGDITYHGPGQMVVYPIFDLEVLEMGIATFVWAMEEIVIRTIAHYGIVANRLSGASGVWITDTGAPRKLCAIGIKASRYCTMHGIALNVNTDLKFFDHIVPCGIADKGVTSLQHELSREIPMSEVVEHFISEMEIEMRIAIK